MFADTQHFVKVDSRRDGEDLGLAAGVLELARDALARSALNDWGTSLRGVSIEGIYRKGFSTTALLLADTGKGPRRLVLKQIHRHAMTAAVFDRENTAIAEFETLRELYPRFAGMDHCSVPRPVAVLPEIHAFIMEFVPGHLLEEDLRFSKYWAPRAGFATLQEHFFLCGRWLRYLHEFTGVRVGGPDAVNDVLVRCADRLRIIDTAGDPRLPKDFRKRVAEELDRLAGQLQHEETLVTGRHSDFGPWNVLVGAGGITVIDFFGFREAPLPMGILKMLVYLDTLRYSLTFSARRIAALQRQFLAGLGPLPRVPPALAMLCELWCRISNTAGTVIATGGGLLQRRERTASLRADLQWFLRGPDRLTLWAQQRM